jgi:UrcA family protein
MTTKTILTAVAAFAAMSVSASAFAAPPSDTDVSVKVSLAGVDLQSQAGAQVALGRIHFAARQICGEEATPDLGDRAQYRACMDQVTQRAVAKLGSAVVTALNGPAKNRAGAILTASR